MSRAGDIGPSSAGVAARHRGQGVLGRVRAVLRPFVLGCRRVAAARASCMVRE